MPCQYARWQPFAFGRATTNSHARLETRHGTDRAALTEFAGLAIWAGVSEEVDAKIREQIRAGTWPLRLKPEDWTSGEINWLIDVIAPDKKTTASVLANFKQVVKSGDLRLHPIIGRLVDHETLEKMGAEQVVKGTG